MNPALLGGVFEIGSKLLDKFFPDPAERAQKQIELLHLQQTGDLKELETRMSAILAEARSTDPWTSRARPSFLYVFYFIILSMVFVAPVIGVFAPDAMDAYFGNVGKGFASIPEEMWWAFTAGYLGYAGARTFEKRKEITR
jgi:hypothetical protein